MATRNISADSTIDEIWTFLVDVPDDAAWVTLGRLFPAIRHAKNVALRNQLTPEQTALFVALALGKQVQDMQGQLIKLSIDAARVMRVPHPDERTKG